MFEGHLATTYLAKRKFAGKRVGPVGDAEREVLRHVHLRATILGGNQNLLSSKAIRIRVQSLEEQHTINTNQSNGALQLEMYKEGPLTP